MLLAWEVAQRAGISPHRVRKDLLAGRLPALRMAGLNGTFLITEAAARAYVAELVAAACANGGAQ